MTVEHARQWGLCPPACGLPPGYFERDEDQGGGLRFIVSG
jgi:hypothetical protein